MSNATQTQVETIRSMTNKEMVIAIMDLQAKVAELTAKLSTQSSTKTDSVEMTDDHARRILSGDLKDKKHKDAAEALGLTYGQVYSCRLEFTFKHIHKELRGTEGYKNTWVKA
jgi:hypothetical protein